MNSTGHVGGLLAVLLVASLGRGDDAKPADKLARLKQEFAAYRQQNTSTPKPGAAKADRAEAIRRYVKHDIDQQAAWPPSPAGRSTWPGRTPRPPKRSKH